MEYILNRRDIEIKINSIDCPTIQDFFNVFIPSSKIQHLLIQNKWIKIDEKNVKREDLIKGDTLSINIYPYDNEYEKSDYKIDVVYEDVKLSLMKNVLFPFNCAKSAIGFPSI